jgi:hypothetical protein
VTALTLIRVPRRVLRKLLKPALLWLNAWRFKQSEFELARLAEVGNVVAQARVSRKQVRLQQQRRRIGGW